MQPTTGDQLVTIIFLDANVLYSRALRDWFALMAIESRRSLLSDRIDLRVSEDVLSEWMYHFRRDKPHYSDDAIGQRRRELVDSQTDQFVVTGYQPVDTAGFPDIHDLHVVAAATHCAAEFLVTADQALHDAADALEPEPMRPDDLLVLISERRMDLVSTVTGHQMKYWSKKAPDVDLPGALRQADAPQFAAIVEDRIRLFGRTGRY